MSNAQVRPGEAFLAILVVMALVGFLALWHRDQCQKERERADRIRHVAAVVRAKIERWPDLEDRYFEELEPLLVDVSEKVEQTHTTEPANRILYKGLDEAKGRSSQRWLDEQLELSVAELAVDVPEVRSALHQTIGEIKYVEETIYAELSISLQAALRDEAVLKLKESPEIGNVLRTKSAAKRSEFLPRVRDVSEPIQRELNTILKMPGSDLLDEDIRAHMLAPVARPGRPLPSSSR